MTSKLTSKEIYQGIGLLIMASGITYVPLFAIGAIIFFKNYFNS